jgi:hypothetical protein
MHGLGQRRRAPVSGVDDFAQLGFHQNTLALQVSAKVIHHGPFTSLGSRSRNYQSGTAKGTKKAKWGFSVCGFHHYGNGTSPFSMMSWSWGLGYENWGV